MQNMGLNLRAGQKAIMAVACDETRNMGRCLQAGKMATPRAGSSELKGSAPAGEDRVIRETCWARRVKVTEMCTSETRRQVTELTETREMEERLHGVEEEEDAHTHTHTCSEGQW